MLDYRQVLSYRWQDGPALYIANRAVALDDAGQYGSADELYQEAVAACKSQGSEDATKLKLFCMDKRAVTLMNRCEYESAQELCENALSEIENHYGRNHQASLLCSGNLARILRYRAKFEQAYQKLHSALEWSNEYPLHTMIGTTLLSILAKTFKEMGIYQQAELLSRWVVQASHSHLGANHPFTYARESDLAVVYSKQERYALAEAISQRAFVGLGTVLGAFHPQTLRTAKRYASYLRFQGRVSEARPILESTLEQQKKRFGYAHPDTLSTLSSLAMVYVQEYQLSLAQGILQKVLAHRHSIYQSDQDHPDIAWTREKLEELDELDELYTDNGYEPNDRIEKMVRSIACTPTRPSVADYLDNVKLDSSGFLRDAPLPDEAAVFELLDQRTELDDPRIGILLRSAAAGGRTRLVERLVIHPASINVNAQGGLWGTALIAACSGGYQSTVKMLLDQPGINVDARNGGPLRVACYHGRVSIVDMLLDRGADPNQRDHILKSPIVVAQAQGHMMIVRTLLKSGAKVNLDEMIDPLFGSPEQKAAVDGHVDTLQWLQETRGVDPDETQGFFGDALLLAAVDNQQRILRALLRTRSRVSSTSRAGAVRHAIVAGNADMIAILQQPTRGVEEHTTKSDLLVTTLPSRVGSLSNAGTRHVATDNHVAAVPLQEDHGKTSRKKRRKGEERPARSTVVAQSNTSKPTRPRSWGARTVTRCKNALLGPVR